MSNFEDAIRRYDDPATTVPTEPDNFHFTYEEGIDTGPVCAGTQSVLVQPGDTLTTMAQKNINVTDGYVDFRGVDFKIVATSMKKQLTGDPVLDAIAPVFDPEHKNIAPGDHVIMPAKCREG